MVRRMKLGESKDMVALIKAGRKSMREACDCVMGG